MLKCAVIGSVNMDMVVRVDKFPNPGETRTGDSFSIVPGGKGANQAVALGRLGGDVAMAGCIGSDASGNAYIANFGANNVNTSALAQLHGETTGTAVIEVERSGENHIIVVPGANARCDADWLNKAIDALADRDIFLFQLEIPLETVYAAIKKLHAMGKKVIFDPAPAVRIPDDVLACVDYITPNETELRIITADMPDDADMAARMQALKKRGVANVIAKTGADGAYALTDAGFVRAPGFKVTPVDTTAAGDTFNAGLARALSGGADIETALIFANASAAISVTAAGAQGGMPTLEDVYVFLKERGYDELRIS